MRRYSFTEKGEEIAKESGLVELAERLSEEWPESVTTAIANASAYTRENDYLEVGIPAFALARTALKNSLEMIQHEKALNIDSERAWWHHASGKMDDNGRLFAVPELKPFVQADKEVDQLTLSGTLGFEFARRHAVQRMLSENGLSEYGFDDRVDAASFAGAYLLKSLVDSEERIPFMPEAPSMQYEDGAVVRTVTVGGSFHGDFRMGVTEYLNDGIVTPLNRSAEFSPLKGEGVAGYHSIEPYITLAMLEAEYLTRGIKGIQELLGELNEVAAAYSNEDREVAGNMLYADYGVNDIFLMAEKIGWRISDGKTFETSDRELFSAPYLPQSKTLFEGRTTLDGITLLNRGDSRENTPSSEIKISREHYVGIFKLLLEQAKAGMGRTAPNQHFQLLADVNKIIEDARTW